MSIRPPRYAVDARAEYVHVTDDAWDWDRIEQERQQEDAAAKAEERPAVQHLVVKYLSGATRFVLAGSGVQEYFKGTPTIWVLRRLSWDEHTRIRSALERDQRAAFVEACRIGIKEVVNGPAALVGPPNALTYNDMAILHDISPDLAFELGRSVWVASQPLTDAEKKR